VLLYLLEFGSSTSAWQKWNFCTPKHNIELTFAGGQMKMSGAVEAPDIFIAI